MSNNNKKTKTPTFEFSGNKLTFEFVNEQAANHFKLWLCETGEQDYWNWMEYRELEEPESNITGIDFDYFSGNSVRVKCGRR